MHFKHQLLIILFAFICTSVYSQNKNPQPNADAVIISNNARFTLLTPQLIRMEWSETATFEDLASLVFINRNLPAPKFKKKIKSGWLTIETDKLKLFYKINSGKFNTDNLYITFNLNGKEVKWIPGLKDTLNLKGTQRTLDNNDGEKDAHLEDGLISRSGWFLFDDSQTNLFDSTGWVKERTTNGNQDWYFFGYGHEYKKALNDYTQVAGKIPMPPRFAFGYWWSRYWAYSDDELRELITDMHLHNMPIDVLVIDMDWHLTDSLSLVNPKKDEFDQLIGWTGYTWNKKLFPEPEKFLDWTAKQNLKTALNLHPASGIAPYENAYNEFAKAISFDTTAHKNIPMKIEDKRWTEIYFDKVLHPLEKQGIDFWWIDWQQWLENKSIKNLSNTFWLNHIFFTDMQQQDSVRPLLFHRWGGMGNHRYQIGFSGDTHSTWDALDFQSTFTSSAANVGYGYWSHDIGGHMGDDNDAELYLRWIQFGVFSPILRTHCTKSKDIERRMFMYPKEYNMMLDALQMRYALNPYIYNASHYAYETGVSLCRPMYYDYPENENAYKYNKQYFFGNEMIVAPIGTKSENDLSLKKFWLPAGDWFELYTGAVLKGDKEFARNYALNEFPVFVKAGSIIPMYPKSIKNLQVICDTMVLCFIPGGNSSTKIYDDDGTTSSYQTNQFTYTTVNKKIDNNITTVEILPTEGSYDGMKTSLYYELDFPSTYPPEKILVNNVEYKFNDEQQIASWTYDAEKLEVKIFTTSFSRKEKVEVVMTPQQKNIGQEDHLNAKAVLMGRAPLIIEKLKYALNSVDPFANLATNILKIGSLKSEIAYHPFNTLELLTSFDLSYGGLLDDIQSIPQIDSKEIRNVMKLLTIDIHIIPNPKIEIEKTISDDPVKVKLSSDFPEAKIYYTTDNSIPTENSNLYSGEFLLAKTCVLKSRCFVQFYMQSEVASIYFRRMFAKGVTYKFNYKDQYNGGNKDALIDGLLGSEKDFAKKWIGFEGDDMVATVELKKSTQLKSITARFLESETSWIFGPKEVQFEVSTDGINFKTVYSIDRSDQFKSFNKTSEVIQVTANCDESNIRFVKVTAKNIGTCPDWHYGKGGKAWLFTDELIVE